MKQLLRAASLTLLMVGASLAADPTPSAPVLPECQPTGRLPVHNYPGAKNIPPSNNLMLPTGKSIAVEGQPLILRGRIFDSQCKPIPETVVEIWQTDPFGHWYLAEGDDLANPNPTFAGAGRAITDGTGQFAFITVFPGGVVGKGGKGAAISHAPFINIRVKAPGIKEFTTALFFDHDRRNQDDQFYRHLSIEKRNSVKIIVEQGADNSLNGTVDIVLPGKAMYRTY